MVPFLLVTLLTPPAPPAAPPQAQVEVRSRAIRIPYLPAEELSHSEFKATSAVLRDAQADVEKDLRTSLAALALCAPLPKPLTVPGAFADTAREFVQIANGREYQAMETTFIQAWDQWQDFLVATKLGKGVREAGKGTPVSAEDRSLKQRMATMAGSRKYQEADDWKIAVFFATSGLGGYDEESALELMEWLRSRRDDRVATQQMQAVVAVKAPQLAEAWKPMADRLNEDAVRLVNLEATPGLGAAPVLVSLQTQARTRLLDRVRKTLWLCNVILCQQKGEPQPAPLSALAPAGATQP
jgi:hypothetical protein